MNDPTYNTINNKDWIIPHSHQIKLNQIFRLYSGAGKIHF